MEPLPCKRVRRALLAGAVRHEHLCAAVPLARRIAGPTLPVYEPKPVSSPQQPLGRRRPATRHLASNNRSFTGAPCCRHRLWSWAAACRAARRPRRRPGPRPGSWLLPHVPAAGRSGSGRVSSSLPCSIESTRLSSPLPLQAWGTAAERAGRDAPCQSSPPWQAGACPCPLSPMPARRAAQPQTSEAPSLPAEGPSRRPPRPGPSSLPPAPPRSIPPWPVKPPRRPAPPRPAPPHLFVGGLAAGAQHDDAAQLVLHCHRARVAPRPRHHRRPQLL